MRRAALIALAAGLAGCGGPGRDEAVGTAQTWLRAVADGKTEQACDAMLPAAVAALAVRFTDLGDGPPCDLVVKRYADAFKDGELDEIAGSLEAEGAVKDDEIGVFPATGERELQVVLMQHRDGVWKVGSTTLSP